MKDSLPTARELEALEVFWAKGEATVRDVYRELQAANPELAYTTVLSLIQTMERKGLVRREGHGRGLKHMYQATVSLHVTKRKLAGDFLSRVFDGAVSQYLVSALEFSSPDAKQLRELEQMIAEAKKQLRKR
jgi:predicted transcriptional regulator